MPILSMNKILDSIIKSEYLEIFPLKMIDIGRMFDGLFRVDKE